MKKRFHRLMTHWFAFTSSEQVALIIVLGLGLMGLIVKWARAL